MHFPWLSPTSISRYLKSLEAADLIVIGNFNRAGFDRTQWFALNEDGIQRLSSVSIAPAIFQNEKWRLPKRKMEVAKTVNAFPELEGSIYQNGGTIPKSSTETTAKSSDKTPPAPQQPTPTQISEEEEQKEALFKRIGLKK